MEKATNWLASHFPSVFLVRWHRVSKNTSAVLRLYSLHCDHCEAEPSRYPAGMEIWDHMPTAMWSSGSLRHSLRFRPKDYSKLIPGDRPKEDEMVPFQITIFDIFQKTNLHQSSPPIKGWSWMKTLWRKSLLCSSLPLPTRLNLQNWPTESPDSPSWATWSMQHHRVSLLLLHQTKSKHSGQPQHVDTYARNLPLLVLVFCITNFDHSVWPCIIHGTHTCSVITCWKRIWKIAILYKQFCLHN